MQFANFNVTFGEEELPMLSHFDDIIYPAFTSGYTNGKENELPRYYFNDIEIKTYEDKFVLVGNFVKDDELERRTLSEGQDLVPSPITIPTSPYSRFTIFLENHRMFLIKNEPNSPDIRSFQVMARKILDYYIREINKTRIEDGETKLPIAIVNIIDTPSREEISEVLEQAEKIKWLNLRFFPLNNDLDLSPVFRDIRSGMQSLDSKNSNWKINSPNSKEGALNILEDISGLIEPSMEIVDKEGSKKKVSQKEFKSSKKIPFGRDIIETDDENLISISKENKKMNEISNENKKIYESSIHKIHKLKEI